MLGENTLVDQKVFMKYICDENFGLGVDRTVLKVYLGRYEDGTKMYEFSVLGSKLPLLLNSLTSEEQLAGDIEDYCEKYQIEPLVKNIKDFISYTAFHLQ